MQSTDQSEEDELEQQEQQPIPPAIGVGIVSTLVIGVLLFDVTVMHLMILGAVGAISGYALHTRVLQ